MDTKINNTTLAPKQYAIRNWRRFQHYKHRNPPWIKLHTEILSSEDFVVLDDASKLLAVVCMVIAAKHNGLVPAIPAYLKRVAYLDKEPNLKPLIECGFLVESLADDSVSKQLRTNADTETETETDKKVSIRAIRKKPKADTDPEFETFWKVYPKRKGSNPKHPASLKFQSAVQTGHDPEAIIAGAKRYAQEESGNAGTPYIAQAVTWLNQCRWQDYGAAPTAVDGAASTQVFVHEGTTEWDAWQTYSLTMTGKRSPVKNGGWWFPTPNPPQEKLTHDEI